MSANIPYREELKVNKPSLGFDRDVSPVWAHLLYKGVAKRDKLSKGIESVKDDPTLLFKGLFGKSLLDKHIHPFMDKILPDSVKLDVLRQKLRFSPRKNLDIDLAKRGGTTKLGLKWRF